MGTEWGAARSDRLRTQEERCQTQIRRTRRILDREAWYRGIAEDEPGRQWSEELHGCADKMLLSLSTQFDLRWTAPVFSLRIRSKQTQRLRADVRDMIAHRLSGLTGLLRVARTDRMMAQEHYPDRPDGVLLDRAEEELRKVSAVVFPAPRMDSGSDVCGPIRPTC